ncbi:lipopolysaccharide biosynthesis protein [Nonlabens antarcticus]|uniref:lipopolysaccharide biosynthesis protein n=1 Tax=Nonlabens antarcticus TaxID=392714 RepID=UPI001890E895|nr:oligosaccharide flippase family protein [Nonlabens antarcticus]
MNKQLLNSFLFYGVSTGLSRFISLILIPIYVRYFNTSEYGVIDIIQTVVSVIVIFGILQLETSIQRYYYETRGRYRKMMISTVCFTIFFISIVLVIVISIFSKLISTALFDIPSYSTEIIVASLIIPFLNITVIFFIVLRYLKKPVLFSVLILLQVVTSAGLTLLLVLKFDLGIKSVFLGQLAGYIIVAIVQLYVLRNNLVLQWNRKILKKMLVFAIPQFPARIGSASVTYLNRFVMLSLLTTSAIGIFSVALKFASVMQLLNISFSMAWIPFMYENLKKSDHKEIYKTVFEFVIQITFVVVFVVSLFSKEIIQLFTVEAYYDAAYLLPGLILYNALFIVKAITDIGIVITKKMIYISYVYFIGASVNVGFLYLGIYFFDLKGVVYSMLLTNIVIVFLGWFFSEKLYHIGMNLNKYLLYLTTSIICVVVLMNYNFNDYFRYSLALLSLLFMIYQNKGYVKKFFVT